jgi:hypothetical protein
MPLCDQALSGRLNESAATMRDCLGDSMKYPDQKANRAIEKAALGLGKRREADRGFHRFEAGRDQRDQNSELVLRTGSSNPLLRNWRAGDNITFVLSHTIGFR